ncbi:ER protein Pkr1-domain-containing protein [Pterulicium gracile]|uniref:ER protein Pkr1-domain-containing protein n=1 Tax=Pterulicium gracile TaxID=1884261 RepID=A0A5C3QET4_9AGAR|nr:ER protein Pkr1-domain-containing protein [Pterula gracilis]
MSTSAMSTPPAPSQSAGEEGSFFDNILTPGSSLNSTFLAILDTVFAALLCILLSLVWLTGSIHFVFLVLIELGLWGSVKWFVRELKAVKQAEAAQLKEPTESKKTS